MITTPVVTSNKRQGAILVIAIMVLLVAALAAVVSLNSSRQNVSSSARVQNKIAAGYATDEALNKALAKIKRFNDWYVNTAQAGRLHARYVSDTDDVTQLTNCESTYTWTSADDANLDVVYDSGKQICNFLGGALDNADRKVRVSVRRDKEFYDPVNGFPVGVYLVSAIAKRNSGAVDKSQMVVVTPLRARVESGMNFTFYQDSSSTSIAVAKTSR